jgi:hypothetical protein
MATWLEMVAFCKDELPVRTDVAWLDLGWVLTWAGGGAEDSGVDGAQFVSISVLECDTAFHV